VTLNLLALPATAAEEEDAGRGDGAFCHHDGSVYAVGTHADCDRQKVGEGNLQKPEAEEMDDSGRHGVAGTVESLEHDHAVGLSLIHI